MLSRLNMVGDSMSCENLHRERNAMVKVCHVTSAHPEKDKRVFNKECVSLAAAGYEVYQVARGKSEICESVHCVGLGKPPRNRIFRMTVYARKAYLTARKLDCDIYHLHDPELLPYTRKFQKLGKKVIFDSHENILEQMSEKRWIPGFIRPFIQSLFNAYVIPFLKRADAIIAVTPQLKEMFLLYNQNAFLITNFPILDVFEGDRIKEKDTFQLCYTGGVGESWNHESVLRAIHGINGVRYVICGNCDISYLNKLKSYPEWEKVEYLGVVPFSKSKETQLHSNAGVALLQPGNNTFGNDGTLGNTKVFEYMMAGLPIICTNFVLWREFIERYHCGICVDPENVDEIANAIRYLLDNPEEARHMGENGCRAVEQEFNWGVEEKKLLKLYRELSNGQ